MISIIIPAFNQLEYCRQCITSLQLNTPQPHKLILVDNGSSDGVSEYFDSIAGATVLHTGTNLGFAGGVNAGLDHAEGHPLLLNSDTLLPRDWLPRLERALLRQQDIGIVGPMSNEVSGIQRIEDLHFTSLDEVSDFADQRALELSGTWLDVPRVVGFCMLIRDTCWKELGPFDTRFGIGNFEDDDYCRRATLAGFRLCVAADAFVFHYGSRTFHAMGLQNEAWRALIEKNYRIYRKKWDAPKGLDSTVETREKTLIQEAKAAYASGNLPRAAGLYLEVIRLNPDDPVVYNDLGVVLHALGETPKAVAYIEHALRIDPSFEDAVENLRALRGQ